MDDLTLPEQFVLLLHRPNGSPYVTNDHTGAAEIGELALRGEAEIKGRKVRGGQPEPDAPEWVRAVLGVVQQKAGSKNKPVDIGYLLRARHSAIKTHRAALLERGLLRHERRKMLGLLPDHRYVPDTVAREKLIQAVRDAAGHQRVLDNRLAPLCALVSASGLGRSIGFDRRERAALKSVTSGDALGSAVEQHVSAATAAAVSAATAAATTAVISSGGS